MCVAKVYLFERMSHETMWWNVCSGNVSRVDVFRVKTYRVNIWRAATHRTNYATSTTTPCFDYPSTKGAFIKWSYTKYVIPNKIAAPNRVQVT